MITKKELSDFAKYCQTKYQVEIEISIIEDFIKANNSNENSEGFIQNPGDDQNFNCHTDDFGCSHLNFDSSKCPECPY